MAANRFIKWLVPGIATTGVGTAIAVALTASGMSADLTHRASAAIASPNFSWASVSIDGRDAILTGVAIEQSAIERATASVAEVHGVRNVNTTGVTLAEVVSPFPFKALRESDGSVLLSGGYPDDRSHATITAAATGAEDGLRRLSGGPDAARFTAGAVFGLEALDLMDQGEVSMADLNLTIEGRAATPDHYRTLLELKRSVPAGISLAALTVTPALASPFTWTATFDGKAVRVTGHTERPELNTELRNAGAGTVVATDLVLASGAPEGFDANVLILLKALLQLESGTVSLSDGTITVSGAPATAEVAEAVTAAVTAIGGTVSLEPPRVADFSFTATKAGDGISFLGYVPDAPTRDRLALLTGADVTGLGLGRGAPDGFASALDFGLEALGHMSEGEFAVADNHLNLTGRATTLEDLETVRTLVQDSVPAGMPLDRSEVRPPIADPFTFTAIRAAGGTTALSGFVPDEEVRATLLAEVDTLGMDTAVIGDGAPETFPASARSGLAVLSLLDSGTLTFDGTAWSLQGAVDTAQKGFAADAAFALAGLRDAGWTYAVQLPAAVTPAAMPMIDPYVWGAQKSLDGRVSFTGFAPSNAFKRFLAVKAGSDTVDSSVVGAGAPDNFIGNATAGLEALLELDEGALNVSGETWSLTGNASSAGTRATIQDRLSSKTDPSQWRVTVQAPEAAPVVTPYLWSAEKSAEGTVILSGYMPSDALRKYVAGRAGTVSRDSSEIASGEPSGFSDDVLAGLEALAHLTNGLARFDGTQWTLSGVADTAAAGKAARVALLGGSRGGAQWRQEIDAPEEEAPAVSEEPPAATNADSIVSLEPLSQPEPVVTAGPSEPATTPSEPSLPPSVTPAVEPVPEATVAIAPAAPVESALAVPSTLVFEASRTRGQAMALSGAVPAEASRSYFGVIADKAPTDAVTIDSTLPSDFIASATAAVSGIRQLAEGRAGFDGTRWWLTGKAADEATRDAVVASIEGLPNSIDWSTKVDLVPAIDLCRDTVSALASRNIITFQSGSAKLADSSGAALDELAVDLQICPDATVHVEGHTDADGPEEINLALSVSRAEAVVEALITRGVAIERLYAEGYGESVPIASNDTRDGKAANRRIAFTITEGD